MLDRTAYGNREKLMDDLARIMREEIADLAARGCTYLQMDEVPLAVICDPKNMEVMHRRGDDPSIARSPLFLDSDWCADILYRLLRAMSRRGIIIFNSPVALASQLRGRAR